MNQNKNTEETTVKNQPIEIINSLDVAVSLAYEYCVASNPTFKNQNEALQWAIRLAGSLRGEGLIYKIEDYLKLRAFEVLTTALDTESLEQLNKFCKTRENLIAFFSSGSMPTTYFSDDDIEAERKIIVTELTKVLNLIPTVETNIDEFVDTCNKLIKDLTYFHNFYSSNKIGYKSGLIIYVKPHDNGDSRKLKEIREDLLKDFEKHVDGLLSRYGDNQVEKVSVLIRAEGSPTESNDL